MKRKRFRRYEHVEREDAVGKQATEISFILDDVARRHEFVEYLSREKLLVALGDVLASVRQARAVADRLCWKRIPARRRTIEEKE
jgi:hypothetical protein